MHLLDEQRQLNLPPCYPSFSLPVTERVLASLYSKFRVLPVFEGILPQTLPIKLNGRLKNASGRACWSSSKGLMWIDIARHAGNDQKKVVDVLLHEMIHIWQFVSHRKGGHGSDFKAKGAILNKMGFAISTYDTDHDQVQGMDTYYLLVVNYRNVFYSKTDINPSKVVKAYLSAVGRTQGDWVYYTTQDASVIRYDRITANGSFPRTIRAFKPSYIDALVKSAYTKEIDSGSETVKPGIGSLGIGGSTPSARPSPMDQAMALLNSSLSYAKRMKLADYTRLILKNIPEYKSISNLMGGSLFRALGANREIKDIAAKIKAVWDACN